MAWVEEKRGKFNMGQAGPAACHNEGLDTGAEEQGMFGKWRWQG